jgi:hypothetical protein
MALKQHSFIGNGHKTNNGTMSVARRQILKQEQMATVREGFGKHIPAAMDTHATEEQCFLHGPCRGVISKGQG